MLRVAIDIGGTFTDVVAETPAGLASVKVLTQTRAPELGALDGIERVLEQLSKTYADISTVVHGTTLATNALIERRGAKTAFVTTKGFRDVLEMRYEKRFDQYALDIELPEPLVPRPLRLSLSERILATGEVLQAPCNKEIDTLAQTLKDKSVEAVAIGFLHSYKNPAHEDLVRDRLASQLADNITLCTSSDVAGEIREFERFSTVCANAYVRPLITQYLNKLEESLKHRGFAGNFLLMLSDGALTTLDQATRFPVRLIEGGPAGGVALAAHVSKKIRSDKTLSLDIGGTTAKICFIQNGQAQTTRRFEVDRAWRGMKGSGLPIKVPTVELVEIGAGGGSITSVDSLDRLMVGPQSAGSDPGPAAYNLGGKEATITDAHIAVGNLSVDGFAGGLMDLSETNAVTAIRENVQQPLGFRHPQAAGAGIIEMANETMANAARVHGVEQGLSVAEFDLLVSGGGGGLHAISIAEKLGIERVIVPGHAGVGSAIGFLRSPVAFEKAVSIAEDLDTVDTAALNSQLDAIQTPLIAIVSRAANNKAVNSTVDAEVRYRGQGFELSFAIDTPLSAATLKGVKLRFITEFERSFGFTLDDIAVELVSITIKVSEQSTASDESKTHNSQQIHSEDTIEWRKIYELGSNETVPYRAFKREFLPPHALAGPLVLTEAQTTTLVKPGWQAHTDNYGHLILEKQSAAQVQELPLSKASST